MGTENDLVDRMVETKPEASPQIIDNIRAIEIEPIPDEKTANSGESPKIPNKVSESPFAGVNPTTIPKIISFDPEIHVVDEHGNPVLTTGGGFRKKPGRKGGSKNSSTTVSVKAVVEQAAINPDAAQARATAIALVSTMFILGQSIGGEEWRPIKDEKEGIDEAENLTSAWEQYFIAVGNISLPAWAGVVIATGAYIAPRFTMPKTQGKLKRFWTWIKPYFGGK